MESVTIGPHTLAGAAIPGIAQARRLLEQHHITVFSSLFWRTGPDLSIPRRVLPDSMLFVPVHGTIEITVGGRRCSLAPGQAGLLPEGIPHAARYAQGSRELTIFAVHARICDVWGNHAFSRFTDPAPVLPDPAYWLRRLGMLTTVINRDAAAGKAIGAALIANLLADLVLSGAPLLDDIPGVDPRIAAAVAAINDPVAPETRVARLAKSAGLSAVRFRALFRRALGVPPKDFICSRQLNQAADRLRAGDEAVKSIAAACGFASDHYFHQRFKLAYGMTPSQWRQRMAAPGI
jgi:AraC-like DNA-binding protein